MTEERISRRDHYELSLGTHHHHHQSHDDSTDRDHFRSKYSNGDRERSSDRKEVHKRSPRHENINNNINNSSNSSENSNTPRNKKVQEHYDKKIRKSFDESDSNALMEAMLGINGFGSTKNKKVKGNETNSAVANKRNEKKDSFRQYMNRSNGFNRPLSPPPGSKKRANS